MLRPTEKTIAETRAALDAGSRPGSYWCDSLIVSRLAEAALAAGDLASGGAALQEAFALSSNRGSVLARRLASGRWRYRAQTAGAGSTAARNGLAQWCPRFVEADPRAGRGRRDHEGRRQRPRATGGDRLNNSRPSARGQTEHRFGIKRGIPACIVLVAFGRCLQGNKIPAKKGRKSDLWLDLADARSGRIRS